MNQPPTPLGMAGGSASARLLPSLLLYGGMAALLVVIYHVLGNSTMPEAYTRSAFRWMVRFWNYAQGFGGAPYTQGWMIPLVSLALIWRQRTALRAAPKQASYAGLAILILALFAHWAGVKSQQTRVSLISLAVVLWAIPFYLGGRRVAGLLLFPCALLLFCVPLNFLDSALFPLRILSTQLAGVLLNGFGIPVRTSGSTLLAEGNLQFEGADAAGSIRNVLALAAFAAVVGHLRQTTLLKQWAVFALGLPLALLANVARILLVALCAQLMGGEAARWLQAHAAGPLVLLFGALFILLASAALRGKRTPWATAWKSDPTPTTS